MPRIPLGRCQSCGATVSYFARSCPSCGASNLPNPVVTGLALGAVVVIGLLVALGSQLFVRGKVEPRTPPAASAPSDQKAQATGDYGWLVQAMVDCEEEAKRVTDKLYFLIVPLSREPKNVVGWSTGRIGMVGESIDLLQSSNAVLGLRNGSLALHRAPLTFAISDPATSTTYQWQPAAGVTVLTTRDQGFDQLKLGFRREEGKDIEWGLTIALSKGTCYWIFPLVRAAPRSG
jgi:hypothetical protein